MNEQFEILKYVAPETTYPTFHRKVRHFQNIGYNSRNKKEFKILKLFPYPD